MAVKSHLYKILFILCASACFAQNEHDAYLHLDRLALEANADKSSAYHNYTRVYAKYFDALRNEPIKFLEIGIYHGDSVKLWESYFVNAQLHFIDVNPAIIKYFSTRSKYHYINHSDTAAVHSFAKSVGGNFDIILDDGGHTVDQQILSFQTLFPYLKSGGMYIIEDLHTSYWHQFGGHGNVGFPRSGPGTCVHFLQGLVDQLNYVAGVTQCADPAKVPLDLRSQLSIYQQDIDSIHFYRSLCIIFKR